MDDASRACVGGAWWADCECEGGKVRGVCDDKEGCDEVALRCVDIIGIDEVDVEARNPDGIGILFR